MSGEGNRLGPGEGDLRFLVRGGEGDFRLFVLAEEGCCSERPMMSYQSHANQPLPRGIQLRSLYKPPPCYLNDSPQLLKQQLRLTFCLAPSLSLILLIISCRSMDSLLLILTGVRGRPVKYGLYMAVEDVRPSLSLFPLLACPSLSHPFLLTGRTYGAIEKASPTGIPAVLASTLSFWKGFKDFVSIL